MTTILLGVASATVATPPRNAVLISIDTLRPDHLHCYGYAERTSAAIDALASEGTLFENAFTPVPLTLPAHTSMLSGLYPPRTSVRDNGFFRCPDGVQLISEAAKSGGYVTAAFVSGFPLNRRFGLAQGFDVYDDRTDSAHAPLHHYPERQADDTISSALKWLQSVRPPFFLFVHLFDPHAEYRPHPEFPGLQPYDAEIASADAAVGRLIERLRQNRLLENTFIALTSDHGESLGEHGERTHGVFLYDATLRVPLIIRGPGIPAARRQTTLVSIVDIVPTITHALGLPENAKLDGVDLLSGKSHDYVYSESFYPRFDLGWSELLALRAPDAKYVEAPRPELYLLAKDPRELNNRLAGESERAALMRSRLLSTSSMGTTPSPAEPDAETRDTLRSLGYVQAGRPSAVNGLPDPKDRIKLLAHIDDATALVARGDRAGAARVLKQTLDQEPANPELATLYADVLDDLGDSEQLFQFLRSVRPLHYPRLLLALARSFTDRGETRQAREVLGEAAAAGADAVQVANETAIAMALDGDLEGATDRLRTAVAIDPGFREAWSNLGHVYNQRGNYGEALASYRHTIELGEPTAAVLNGAGIAALQIGDLDQAESLLRSSLKLEPAAPGVEINLARVLLKSGKPKDALALLDHVLDHPSLPPPLTAAAQALRDQITGASPRDH